MTPQKNVQGVIRSSMNILQMISTRSSTVVCRYVLDNLPRHSCWSYCFFKRAGDVDARGPSDYASAVNSGDMDDGEEDEAESPGSPVLLKSYGTKRDWEDDADEQKVRISHTRERSVGRHVIIIIMHDPLIMVLPHRQPATHIPQSNGLSNRRPMLEANPRNHAWTPPPSLIRSGATYLIRDIRMMHTHFGLNNGYPRLFPSDPPTTVPTSRSRRRRASIPAIPSHTPTDPRRLPTRQTAPSPHPPLALQTFLRQQPASLPSCPTPAPRAALLTIVLPCNRPDTRRSSAV